MGVMARAYSTLDTLPYAVALIGPLAICMANLSMRASDEPAFSMPAIDCAAAPDALPALPVAPESPEDLEPDACWLSEGAPFVHPTPAPAPQPTGLQFALLYDGGAVLTREARADWGTGPITGPARAPAHDGLLTAQRTADPAAVPAAFQRLDGVEVDVFGRRGKLCRGTLGAQHIEAAYNGAHVHDPEDDSDEANAARARRRAQVFDEEQKWLVAHLRVDEPCDLEGAIFVREASLPSPRMWLAASGTTSRARKDAFLNAAAARLRDPYETYLQWEGISFEEDTPLPDWDAFARNTYRRRIYHDGAGNKRALFQFTGDATSMCGNGFQDYSSALISLDADHAEDAPVVRLRDTLPHPPTALIDVDGDGVMEVLLAEEEDATWGFSLLSGNGTLLHDNVRPYMGCAC